MTDCDKPQPCQHELDWNAAKLSNWGGRYGILDVKCKLCFRRGVISIDPDKTSWDKTKRSD